ncbi:methyltransferase domain-containing protein [Gordonia sp. SID5947]|uniref:class I SAM-dependent methyltransferase n=1 Tax=Gordonia sp. SID5947 TaxID=2690315 RepID=UPI00136DE620|nr:class I SAM-dependent methyltransferase [Gordonia sp. SID5947]MYR07367.1 methyltransferase domain-containing protein [Gordonia sp. SID5947]
MVDWDGDRYGDVSALQRMVAEASIHGLELAGDERLLDVGCGDGFITMQLAGRLPAGSVVGVDASRRMIDNARARDPADELGVQFHVDDVLALPFDRDFDIVVSFNMLHWVHDHPAALARIARSLDTGGRAVVQIVCATERRSIEDVAMGVAATPHWQPHFEDFPAPYLHATPDQFRESATTAGMTVSGIEISDLRWQFESIDAFASWFGVGASDWTSRLPDDSASAFAHEVVERYQESIGEPATLHFGQMRVELELG